MRIFLIGFMGSGKTYTAAQLAELLGKPFLDLDQYIEEKGGQSISKIFEFGGPDHFRQIERNALATVIDEYPDHIIATGGGTPVYFDNLVQMKENGLVIYLDVQPDLLYQRVVGTSDQRPLLKRLSGAALKDYITTTLENRLEYYLQAHIAVEVTQDDINPARIIAGYLGKMYGKEH